MSSPLRSVRSVGLELWSEGRGRVLVTLAFGWFLSMGIRVTVPALLPYIRAEFGFDLTTAGLLLTLLWSAYALGQFPGGILADWAGERTVLVTSTALGAVAAVVVAAAVTPVTVLVAIVGLGLTTALYGPTRFTILSDIYDRRDGVAMGLTQSAGHVGNAVVPVVAGTIAAAVSWRAGFVYTIPAFLLTAVGLWFVIPTRTGADATDETVLPSPRYVCRQVVDPRVAGLTMVLLVVMFVIQAFTGFYTTYLTEIKELRPETAAALFGLFYASGTVVQPVAGAGGDRFSATRVMCVALAIGLIPMAAFPFVDGLYPIAGLTLAAGALLGVTPVALARLVRGLPADMNGTGLGLLRTVYFLGGATGPLVFGAFANRGRFEAAFGLLAGLIVATLLLAVLVGSD